MQLYHPHSFTAPFFPSLCTMQHHAVNNILGKWDSWGVAFFQILNCVLITIACECGAASGGNAALLLLLHAKGARGLRRGHGLVAAMAGQGSRELPSKCGTPCCTQGARLPPCRPGPNNQPPTPRLQTPSPAHFP